MIPHSQTRGDATGGWFLSAASRFFGNARAVQRYIAYADRSRGFVLVKCDARDLELKVAFSSEATVPASVTEMPERQA